MTNRNDVFALQEKIGGAWRTLTFSSYLPDTEEMLGELLLPGAFVNVGKTRIARFRLHDLDDIAGISRDFEIISPA